MALLGHNTLNLIHKSSLAIQLFLVLVAFIFVSFVNKT